MWARPLLLNATKSMIRLGKSSPPSLSALSRRIFLTSRRVGGNSRRRSWIINKNKKLYGPGKSTGIIKIVFADHWLHQNHAYESLFIYIWYRTTKNLPKNINQDSVVLHFKLHIIKNSQKPSEGFSRQNYLIKRNRLSRNGA